MSNQADDRSETESGSPQEDAQNLVPSGEDVVSEDSRAEDSVADADPAEDIAVEDGVVEDDPVEDIAEDGAAEDVVAEGAVVDDAPAEDAAAENAVADDAVVEESAADEGIAAEDVAEDGAFDPAPAAEDDVVVEGGELDAEPVDEPGSVDDPVSVEEPAPEDVEATEVLSLDSPEPTPAEADATAEVPAEADPAEADSTAEIPVGAAEDDGAAEVTAGGDIPEDDSTQHDSTRDDSTRDDSAEGEDLSEPAPTEVLAAAPITGEGGTTVLPLPPPAVEDAQPAKPKKRSRTVMIAVISVLAVLAALIVGDRIANATAQNSLAESLQQELAIPDKPNVSIGGFPFATQALAGSFSSIQVSADNVPVHTDVANLTIAKLDATLTGITVTDSYANIMANRGEATALVSWEEASKLAGQPVTYVADNQMQIDFTIPIGQLSIKGAILGSPQLNAEDQTISVANPKITLSNMDIPQPIAEAVSKIALQPFPIRGLPYDIKITALAIQPDGISVSGSGANIPIRQQQ